MRVDRSQEFDEAAEMLVRLAEIEQMADGVVLLDIISMQPFGWAKDETLLAWDLGTEILVPLPGPANPRDHDEGHLPRECRAALAQALSAEVEYLPEMAEVARRKKRSGGPPWEEALTAAKRHLGYA